jgi:uncharacterized protein (TIGR03435 family)
MMSTQFAVIAAVLCYAALLFHQNPTRLVFEVASIKQADTTLPGLIRGISCHGVDGGQGHPLLLAAIGRCRVMGWNLKQLVASAYSFPTDRISGGPGWADSLSYTIEAKAEDPPTYTRAQLYQMLQSLLEDRFKLKFHRETREVHGYGLIPGKDGLKLKPVEAGVRGQSMSQPRIGEASGHVSIAGIASLVSRSLGVPVSDDSGIAGIYEFSLRWTPEANIDPAAADGAERTGPSIFTAVQEQLGLRLEPKKVSLEWIVIDSVEKPQGN